MGNSANFNLMLFAPTSEPPRDCILRGVGPSMSNSAAASRKNEHLEQPEERNDRSMIWETCGVATGLIGLFLLISLLIGQEGESLVGPVGSTAAEFFVLLLGKYVAFLVPVVVFWFSVQVFRGRLATWSPGRLIGITLVIIAVTGMLALPTADSIDSEIKNETFQRAGAIGTFMVNWEGLRLVGTFGTLGAGMMLVGLALIGTVLITNLKFSDICIRLIRKMRRDRLPQDAIAEPAEEPARKPRQRRRTLLSRESVVDLPEPASPGKMADDDSAEEDFLEEEEKPSRGFFGGLFHRRKKESHLPEPAPEESRDFDDELNMGSYDEDALAAVRALEEARIDEEYERALKSAIASGEDDESEIVFHDSSKPLNTITGNPANEDPGVADGLAKMFPSRWEKEDGDVKRRDPNAKSDEDIRDAAESRALGYADDGSEDDSDPLFNDDLDTRPAGPMAAQEAAQRSAMDEEARAIAAERHRQLLEYRLPDVELLDNPPQVDHKLDREEMLEISQTLEKTFADFNIQVKVVEVKQGPVVTRFELKPAPGVKVSRIVSLEHDVALAMRAQSVRIVAPIPGKAAVGIEIPNKKRAGVYLKELVSCPDFWDHPSPLGFALGKTIDGQPYFADLKKMPHLLIAGATGAGKSVCLNTIICSFLYRMRPDRLRLLLVDPKRVEMSIYDNIPHLISPVVCEPKSAAAALAWVVEQMEERYKKLVEFKVRNIDGYNKIARDPDQAACVAKGKTIEVMPHLVIVVDELADLMVVAKNEVEESIQRLAQMARAVGIHLILATQRPSVNVITGVIKANFPTRVAFQVRQKVDSRTILDSGGAEALLGRGDMLFAPAGAAKPIRIQGAFLSDEEVEHVVDHCRQQAEPMYEVEEFEPLLNEKEQRELARLMGTSVESLDDLAEQDRIARGTNKTMGKVNAGMFVPHEGGSANSADEEIDEALVRAAARVILEGRKGSTSLIQRRLKVGFARAGRLMDMLEEMGLVGPYKGPKPRDLLVDCDLALEQLDRLEEQIKNTGDSRKAAEALDGAEKAG